jgi:hypothetical protein
VKTGINSPRWPLPSETSRRLAQCGKQRLLFDRLRQASGTGPAHSCGARKLVVAGHEDRGDRPIEPDEQGLQVKPAKHGQVKIEQQTVRPNVVDPGEKLVGRREDADLESEGGEQSRHRSPNRRVVIHDGDADWRWHRVLPRRT